MFQFSLTVVLCSAALLALLIGFLYVAEKLGLDLGAKQGNSQQQSQTDQYITDILYAASG